MSREKRKDRSIGFRYSSVLATILYTVFVVSMELSGWFLVLSFFFLLSSVSSGLEIGEIIGAYFYLLFVEIDGISYGFYLFFRFDLISVALRFVDLY